MKITDIYYLNSRGEKLNLLTSPYQLQTANLFDYSWDYSSITRRRRGQITAFAKGITAFTLLLGVNGYNEKVYRDAIDHFCEVTEYDLLNLTPGRLYVGEFYINCYIKSSKKTDWEWGIETLDNEIEVIADYPYWCREKEYHFYMSSQSVIDESAKEENDNIIRFASLEQDYKHDYPKRYQTRYRPAKKRYLRDYKYDYYHNHQLARLDNDHFVESGFKMTIYGPCTDPKIWIGDHLYHVAVTLYDSEYLVIDSRERTVVRYARNGVQENCFGKRDNKNYVFQKIPPGKNAVKWNATYSFDLTLYQERSEPPWR